MCNLFISVVLALLIAVGIITLFYALVVIISESRSKKSGYRPVVNYDASTGKLKWRNPPRSH